MLEVVELITAGRCVVLTIIDVPAGIEIAGEKVDGATNSLSFDVIETLTFYVLWYSGGQLKDLNRTRAYLADVAHRYEVPVFKSILQVRLHSRFAYHVCPGYAPLNLPVLTLSARHAITQYKYTNGYSWLKHK